MSDFSQVLDWYTCTNAVVNFCFNFKTTIESVRLSQVLDWYTCTNAAYWPVCLNSRTEKNGSVTNREWVRTVKMHVMKSWCAVGCRMKNRTSFSSTWWRWSRRSCASSTFPRCPRGRTSTSCWVWIFLEVLGVEGGGDGVAEWSRCYSVAQTQGQEVAGSNSCQRLPPF